MDRDDTQQPSLACEDEYVKLRADLVDAVVRCCPPWRSDQAEDVVQAALMRLTEIRRKHEENVEVSALTLRKAAFSVVVDEIRRVRRKQEIPWDDEHPEAERAAEMPASERECSGREIAQAIRDCLGRLIRPRRLAVTLHLQGHGVAEVARLFGWGVKRAGHLVDRGLAELRGCLEIKGARR